MGNTWMYQEQNIIQAFAKAYADRIVGEACIETISESTGRGDEFKDCPVGDSPLAVSASPDLEPMLKKMINLHLLARIEEDLSFFLINGIITQEVGENILDTNRKLCADLAPHALSLIEAFDLPEEVLAAPIALIGSSIMRVTTKENLDQKTNSCHFFRSFRSIRRLRRKICSYIIYVEYSCEC